MKYRNNNEFKYVDVPKKKIGNYIIIGIGVAAILITGFLYASKLNDNTTIAKADYTNEKVL
ncbi:MAG: hypothetical protein IJA36_10740 [Lachnospiraceae bacterium]|nr:hypothetical protein [Lachnospiraceae bacterium]